MTCMICGGDICEGEEAYEDGWGIVHCRECWEEVYGDDPDS